MKKTPRNSAGFSAVDGLLIVVLIALVGFVGWYVWHSKNDSNKGYNAASDTSNTGTATKTNSSTPQTAAPAASSGQKLTITPYHGTALDVTAPDGWEKVSGDESRIDKTINSTKYDLSFQITESDYLKLPAYASNSNYLAKTTTAKGTTVYLIKVENANVALSTCVPSDSKGCSPQQNGKPLLVFLATPGRGAPGSLDFSSQSTTTAISDIKSIASSLEL